MYVYHYKDEIAENHKSLRKDNIIKFNFEEIGLFYGNSTKRRIMQNCTTNRNKASVNAPQFLPYKCCLGKEQKH